jgi:hypothetical protein
MSLSSTALSIYSRVSWCIQIRQLRQTIYYYDTGYLLMCMFPQGPTDPGRVVHYSIIEGNLLSLQPMPARVHRDPLGDVPTS